LFRFYPLSAFKFTRQGPAIPGRNTAFQQGLERSNRTPRADVSSLAGQEVANTPPAGKAHPSDGRLKGGSAGVVGKRF